MQPMTMFFIIGDVDDAVLEELEDEQGRIPVLFDGTWSIPTAQKRCRRFTPG